MTFVPQCHQVEEQGKSAQAKSHHGKAHDRTSLKGDTEGDGQTVLIGGLGGPDVGIGRDRHAAPTRRRAQYRTGQKATTVPQSGRPIVAGRIEGVQQEQSDGDDGGVSRQGRVFGNQERAGA